jgi:hypothetical protein
MMGVGYCEREGCRVMMDRNETVNEGDMGCGGYRTRCLPTRAQGAQACTPYRQPVCHMDGAVVPSCP